MLGEDVISLNSPAFTELYTRPELHANRLTRTRKLLQINFTHQALSQCTNIVSSAEKDIYPTSSRCYCPVGIVKKCAQITMTQYVTVRWLSLDLLTPYLIKTLLLIVNFAR